MTAIEHGKQLADLMWAITDELALMSFEMTEFGEIVSADTACQRTQRQKMQSLELMSEKAVMYARLLSLMAQAMDGTSSEKWTEIQTAIADVSFPLVRERLTLAAKNGPSTMASL